MSSFIEVKAVEFDVIPTFNQQPSPMEGAMDGFGIVLVFPCMLEFCGDN